MIDRLDDVPPGDLDVIKCNWHSARAVFFWCNYLTTHRMGRAFVRQQVSYSLGRRVCFGWGFSRQHVLVTHSPKVSGQYDTDELGG
jgi:hypothetical protein